MTSQDHIEVAKALIESGHVEEAQTEVLISIATSLEDLNDRVTSLEETLIHQLSTLAERVEKCLVLGRQDELA